MHSAASWQIVFVVGALVGFGIMAASVGMKPIGRERTVYWTGGAAAAVCAGFIFADRGPASMLEAALVVLFIAAVHAVRSGPSIRIGNRVLSFFPETVDGEPITGRAGYYRGMMSPRRLWWALAVLFSMIAILIHQNGWDFRTVFGAGFISLTGAGIGELDAREGHVPARGQFVPAFVALVASVFCYGFPALAYLLGYSVGKRKSG